MIKGTIYKLLDGYGFIEAEDESRYFFHRSSLVERLFNTLKRGESCTFEVEDTDPRGPAAKSIITYEQITKEI